MISLIPLLRFSRPHTIIGTVVSILALYTIVCDRAQQEQPLLLASALLVGIACNLFIVGTNQVADVEIDRINKPHLPLPAGDLTLRQATRIVQGALFTALVLSMVVSPWLFLVVGMAAGIGWGYSMPPLRLKRHHLPAAIAISTVRGVLINLGGFMVYDHIVNGSIVVPMEVWMLAGFITAFSIGIAWFKDLADVPGDSRYGIRTLAVLYTPRTALVAGHVLVAIAYSATIVLLWLHLQDELVQAPRTRTLLVGHVALFVLFLVNMMTVHVDRPQRVKRFYTRFWVFFFAEYILFLIAYTVPGA